MALTAKTAHDKERQEMFDHIRHLVGSKHQVPDHLSMDTLIHIVLALTLSQNKVEE